MNINTRKQAIDEKCKDCTYDSLDEGTWLFQVESCNDTKCPLHGFRPLTQKTIQKNKDKRYQLMSPEEKVKADKKAEDTRNRFKDAQLK